VRVLIIRPGALGDTLMLLPALKDLSGKVAVTVVGREPGLNFIQPHVDCTMDLEACGWHRLFMEQPDRARLPVPDADVVAAFLTDEDGVVQRNLRAFLPHAAVYLFRSFPQDGEDIHVALYLARCLKSAGLPVAPLQSIEAVRTGALCKGTKLPEKGDKIVLHPGSGSSKKNYPPDFWIALATRFKRHDPFEGLRPIFLLGPAETSLQASLVENLQSKDVEVVISSSSESLVEILHQAVMYVGHDSGITHLSALQCIPTIALFRKSDATQWGPLGPVVHVMENRNPGPEFLEEVLETCARLIRIQRSPAN